MTAYYVDATLGNDGAAGTSELAPWKSYDPKVNGSAFNAGDVIKGKAGEEWREGAIPPSPGLIGNHIIFDRYGVGENPKINGSDLVTTWEVFDPTDIEGCILWLRADTISGLDDGEAVSTWSDESGESNDATQANVARKPTYETNELNSLPVVRFDGTADCLSCNGMADDISGVDTPFSAFVVAKNVDDPVSSWRAIFILRASDSVNPIMGFEIEDTPEYVAIRRETDGAPLKTDAAGTPDQDFHYLSFIFSGTVIDMWEDEVQLMTAGDLDMGDVTGDVFTIGGSFANGAYSNFWEGDIAEIIFFDTALNATNRGLIEAYLSGKYGLNGAQNIWKASFVPNGPEQTDVFKVFFDDTLGTDAGSIDALDAANEWHYDATKDILYVYAESDPDGLSSPGVEATSEDFCIHINDEPYITVDGIDCHKSNLDAIKAEVGAHTCIIKNLALYHPAGHGFLAAGTVSNPYLYNVTASYCGVNNEDHGFYLDAANETNGTWLIEDCAAHNCVGYGFHIYSCGGGTIKNSIAYNNGESGFIVATVIANTTVNFEYCISRDHPDAGFYVYNNDANSITVNIYNCVAYDNPYYGGIALRGNGSNGGTWNVKNCIMYENDPELHDYDDNAGTFTFDNNCYYLASGDLIIYGGITYDETQFAAYQAASGQDANSINADPLFNNAAGGDFTLQSGSPCINAGIDVGLTLDFLGDKVPRGTDPDMGAYEHLNKKLQFLLI